MLCSYPIPIKKKDGTIVKVACGMCKACRINYRNSWKMRMAHELAAHEFNTWIELSYDDLHLVLQNMEYRDVDGKYFSLERKEVQDWLKRFRKEIAPLKVRYFGCGEYGSNGRPHYHVALFGISPDHPAFGPKVMKSKSGWWHQMPSWPFGMTWVDNQPPSMQVGAYIAKYIMKKHKGKDAAAYYEAANINPEFVMMSLKPGIGAQRIDDNLEYYRNNPVFSLQGKQVPITRYMKERICNHVAAEKAASYIESPEYQEFFDMYLEQARAEFAQKTKDYIKKYGLTKDYMTSGECWETYGRQQERNLSKYEKD